MTLDEPTLDALAALGVRMRPTDGYRALRHAWPWLDAMPGRTRDDLMRQVARAMAEPDWEERVREIEVRAGIERIRARFVPGWGTWIDCDEGWWPLLIELDARLAEIKPDYAVVQIKQKFGALDFYIDRPDDRAVGQQMDAVVREFEGRAQAICEVCGAPGETRNVRGWLSTLCDEHAEARRG